MNRLFAMKLLDSIQAGSKTGENDDDQADVAMAINLLKKLDENHPEEYSVNIQKY